MKSSPMGMDGLEIWRPLQPIIAPRLRKISHSPGHTSRVTCQLRDLRHITAQPVPLGVDHRRAIPRPAQEETSMTKFKTIITAAVAALALTTASLAIPGQAFAGGHGHGGEWGPRPRDWGGAFLHRPFWGGAHHPTPFFSFHTSLE